MSFGFGNTGFWGFGTRPAGGGGAVPGTARPSFDLTPLFLYQPQTETGVTLSSGQVTAVTGIGSPDMTAPTSGPMEMTDALGRKFWRFRGSDFLEIAPADITFTPRALTVIAVMRQYTPAVGCNIFGQSYQSDGVSPCAFNRAFMSSRTVVANSAPFLHAGNRSATTATGGATFGAVGAQLQVAGLACNASRTRFIIDGVAGNGTVIENTYSNMKGARLGGYLAANGTTNHFDLYAIAGFAGTLTDAQADAAAAALVEAYALNPATRQVIMEGDSISVAPFSGFAFGAGALLGEPGTNRITGATRVIPIGSSGSTVATLETRMAATNGWPATILPGGSANNILAFQIGVNDASTRTATQIYNDIVAYLGTASTGVLARGFNAVVGVNIATANSIREATLADLRAALRDPAFLVALDAQPGGANEGRVTLLDLDRIEVDGDRPFETTIDSAYYESDNLHPNEAGSLLLVTGGDTPENGWAAVI